MARAWLWPVLILLLGAALWLWITSDTASPTAPVEPPATEESGVEKASAPLLEASGESAPPPPVAPAMPLETRPHDAPASAKEGSYTITGIALRAGTEVPVGEGTINAAHTHYVLADGRMKQEQRSWSGEVDRSGRFKIEINGAPPPAISSFTYEGLSMRVERWWIPLKKEQPYTDAAPGSTTDVRVALEAVFRLQGEVVDKQGTPLEGVSIAFGTPMRLGNQVSLGSQRVRTKADGRFDIGPFSAKAYDGHPAIRMHIAPAFEFPSMTVKRVDPWAVPEEERNRLRVVMDAGATLAGVLLDPDGRALPHVVVEFEVGNDWKLRRASRTDEAGRWQVSRLQRGKVQVRALAFAHGCKVNRELDIDADDDRVELVAKWVPRPDPSKVKQVLGLSLVDVDDKLRKAYELPDEVNILILDVAEGYERLGIGLLEPGYGLWMVGDSGVKNLKEAVDRMLALSQKDEKLPHRTPTARVVYTFANERMRGTNTQHLKLTAEQREELLRLKGELGR